jgi:hypothetical protein
MSPANATETITIRCTLDFKNGANAAADAEGRSLSEFLIDAAERRMASSCSTCGRTDRPTAGAGLSEAADAFLKRMGDERNMSPIVVTTGGRDRPVAYRARLNLQEPSQGLLLLLVDFKQGRTAMSAELPLARGLVSGWQEDMREDGGHHHHLLELGYRNGNDGVIRASMRNRRLRIVTPRVIMDAISMMPGITDQGLRDHTGLYNSPYGATLLAQQGLVQPFGLGGPGGMGYKSVFDDPDDALMAARERGIAIDDDLGV